MRKRDRPCSINEPCIGLVELTSIAHGFEAADQILKAALCHVLMARAVTPGKFLVLFEGSVADVTSALTMVRERFAATLLDDLLLPGVDRAVVHGLEGRARDVAALDALGVVATTTVAAAITAADAAVKKARVELIELQLAIGIGGKGYFVLAGNVADVEAALLAANEVAAERDRQVATVLIPRAHPEMSRLLGGAESS
ncbi:MAG: BMC domain-containing protein [Planctomycetota bacterium]